MTWGVNVIVITAAACILINAITILYQNGRNQKTMAALLSTAVVLILMFVLIYYISGLNEIGLRNTNYGNQDWQLAGISSGPH